MALVFFYPQFKKLTGAERLILRLAAYTARAPGSPPEVVLVTHRLAEECRPALDPEVQLVETGWPMQVTGNHYLDAAVEYLLGPLLALRVPLRSLDGLVFFGPPSVPAMWFTRRVLLKLLRKKVPLLYFCFEPPRFIYSDTDDIVHRLGAFGPLLRPLFSLYRSLDRRMVSSAHQVLSNSPFGSERIRIAYGRRAVVIEHGVDLEPPRSGEVDALRARYGLNGRPAAVTVNHLHPRKRIDLFLKAVHHATRTGPAATAVVVGGGPEREQLERHARALGMEPGKDVIFTGAVPDEEIAAHYGLGSVYVHTGRDESFGLSVIEALKLGLPVVSVDEGGPRDTVQEGQSGHLTGASPQQLGDAIASLLSDPKRARSMGAMGSRHISSRYKWERGAATLLALLV
ncbi:MAG TPA: glycosyltransferase family 4 protein, partial [Chloroflexia bacterium]|nr:glycosyltransferase family 4 protein [Chloroflexia bacterium]